MFCKNLPVTWILTCPDSLNADMTWNNIGFRFLFCINEDSLNWAKQNVSYASKGVSMNVPQTGVEVEAYSDAEPLPLR